VDNFNPQFTNSRNSKEKTTDTHGPYWGDIYILGPGKTTSSSIFVLSGSLGPWWSWFPCGLPFVPKNFPLSCQIRQSIDRSKKSFVKFAVNGANSSRAKCSFICVTVSNNHLTHQMSQLPYLLTCPAHQSDLGNHHQVRIHTFNELGHPRKDRILVCST
jgi:hypothetical protein